MNGKRYYKVKWESSWEPEDSLSEYQDLVDQFWQFVKRVSSDEKDEGHGRKRPRLSDDDVPEDNDGSVVNSEDDIPIKGTITLSEGVKLQESGNFYRLTQDKEDTEQDDSTIFIVQGNQPTHIIKNRTNKSNVHVIGLQHEPKTAATVKKQIRAPDDNVENLVVLKLTDTDKAIGWNNPYVRTTFFCRVCNTEQSFDEEEWKLHFKSHVARPKAKQIKNLDDDLKKRKESTVTLCSDSNIPWIQKVEHLVQTWGVSQYVRIAFLCRYCGKEQQSNHTGNWRNHYQLTHSKSDPVNCEICQLSLRNKSELRKHKKQCIETSLVTESPLNLCPICSQPFRKKSEVTKHVAEKHQIIPGPSSIVKSNPSDCNEIDPGKGTLKIKMFPEKSSQDKASKKAQKQSKKSNMSSSNRNFICGMCYENFKTKMDLKNHQSSVHFYDQQQSSQAAIYNCLKCNESFIKHIDLTNHTIEFHGITDVIPGATIVPREEEERPTQSHLKDSSNFSYAGDSGSESGELVLVIKEEEEEDFVPQDERPSVT